MNQTLLTLGVVAMVALAGCAGLTGTGEQTDPGVEVGDDDPAATNVSQSISVAVDDPLAGEELSAIGATYPREHFVVDAAQHDQIDLAVDTDGDGEPDRTFSEANVSGVNTNAYSFDVTLETGYTLEAGDVVLLTYPAVDNPDEPGEYTVQTRLNGRQMENATVTVG